MEHKIKSMGDFHQCENHGCIYSATWSQGMICDYCKLFECKCPCPLTKDWLRQNSDKIRLKRIHDKLEMDISGFKFLVERHNKEKHPNNKLDESNGCYCDDIRPELSILNTLENYRTFFDECIPKYD